MAKIDFVLPSNSQHERIAKALEALALAQPAAADMLDGTVETYKKVMRKWFLAQGAYNATPEELTAMCDEWYSITREPWHGWVEYNQPSVSVVSDGTKGGDNEKLTCTPSTNTVAGKDDYAGLPLFAVTDCNWIVTDSGDIQITAIDGINDGFARGDPNKYVGVLQMSGYYYCTEGNETWRLGYSSSRSVNVAGIRPVPESVKMDGSVRSWVVHGKYSAGTTSKSAGTGKLTCCAGVISCGWMSHNVEQDRAKENGKGYSGFTSADWLWLELMYNIKYGTMASDGKIQGCCNNKIQYPVAVAEEGVRRVILTTKQANKFLVGMGVFVGTSNNTLNMGDPGMHSISGRKGWVITKKEVIDTNTALYLDADEDFTTVRDDATATTEPYNGCTVVSFFRWPTGTTDTVLGNDGSPGGNFNIVYPARLQGIEYMNGAWEVLADTKMKVSVDADHTYYEPYIVKKVTGQNQTANDFTGYTGTDLIATCESKSTGGCKYIKRMGYKNDMCYPIGELDGNSSTGTKDGLYASSDTVEEGIPQTREAILFGDLWTGAPAAGLSAVMGYYSLGSTGANFVARLSANGFRGEWAG